MGKVWRKIEKLQNGESGQLPRGHATITRAIEGMEVDQMPKLVSQVQPYHSRLRPRNYRVRYLQNAVIYEDEDEEMPTLEQELPQLPKLESVELELPKPEPVEPLPNLELESMPDPSSSWIQDFLNDESVVQDLIQFLESMLPPEEVDSAYWTGTEVAQGETEMALVLGDRTLCDNGRVGPDFEMICKQG